MRKVIKVMLYIFLIAIIIVGSLAAYAWREMGASPSPEELRTYEKLHYFKNGQFQSPQQMVYDFNNVRNGPAGFARFLTQSQFAPRIELPKISLKRDSFGEPAAEFAFYWLGHSSAIMETAGKRLLFDPVFGNAAPLPFGVPRFGNAPLDRKELPPVDYVIITHNHYDHLERKTVQVLKESHFIVPLGVGAALRGWGVPAEKISELGWGDSFDADGLKITAETGVHYSGRSLKDRNKTLWASYVIQTAGKKIFWSGDSGYGSHFAEIGQKYGPFDLAAIEIDGWNTGWPNTHLFPSEAVQAARDLQTKRFIPLHWAVFDLALHPWHESIDMLLDEAQGTELIIQTPKLGERIDFNSETSRWWKTNF